MQARTRPGRTTPIAGSLRLPHVFMVLAGLTTFVLVSVVLRDRSETIDVWMIAADVPAGVTLEAGDVMPVAIPANDPLVPSLLASGDGLPAGTIRHGLVAGEPLLASDLTDSEQTTVGRTFTIPVEAVVIDGLGLSLGDRLDLIGLDASGTTHYAVTDAEVVRLPGAAPSSAFAAARSRDGWVTIDVDDREALRLSEVLARGPVDMVRSTGAAAIAAAPHPNASAVEAGVGS